VGGEEGVRSAQAGCGWCKPYQLKEFALRPACCYCYQCATQDPSRQAGALVGLKRTYTANIKRRGERSSSKLGWKPASSYSRTLPTCAYEPTHRVVSLEQRAVPELVLLEPAQC